MRELLFDTLCAAFKKMKVGENKALALPEFPGVVFTLSVRQGKKRVSEDDETHTAVYTVPFYYAKIENASNRDFFDPQTRIFEAWNGSDLNWFREFTDSAVTLMEKKGII